MIRNMNVNVQLVGRLSTGDFKDTPSENMLTLYDFRKTFIKTFYESKCFNYIKHFEIDKSPYDSHLY